MADFEMQDFLSTIDLKSLIPADPTKALTGGITSVTVEEADDSGAFQANTIIRTDRDWQITLKWALQGSLLNSKFFEFPGTWVVNAFLEAWGANAKDQDLPEVSMTVDQDPQPSPWEYTATIGVKKGTVVPGAYRLAVTLTYKDENGDPGPMAGFIEVPGMIQIYKPSK